MSSFPTGLHIYNEVYRTKSGYFLYSFRFILSIFIINYFGQNMNFGYQFFFFLLFSDVAAKGNILFACTWFINFISNTENFCDIVIECIWASNIKIENFCAEIFTNFLNDVSRLFYTQNSIMFQSILVCFYTE